MARPLGVGGQETIVRGRTCEAAERNSFESFEGRHCICQAVKRVVAKVRFGQDEFEVLKFEQARNSECSEIGERGCEIDGEELHPALTCIVAE